MPDTRFSHISFEGRGKNRKITHYIDQFYWHRDAVVDALPGDLETETIDNRLMSAVKFNLPHVEESDRSFLVAVGDGLSAEFYMIKMAEDRLYKLFSYGRKDFKESSNDLPSRLYEVFTTSITPLLRGGEIIGKRYPNIGHRVYNFALTGSDHFTVDFELCKKYGQDKIELTYGPDSRDGKPKLIAKFIENLAVVGKVDWILEKGKVLGSTQDFTLAGVIDPPAKTYEETEAEV